MLSLSVRYPKRVVTNDYYRQVAPEVVREAEEKTLSRLWAGQHKSAEERGAWSIEMEPFLSDPFRGTQERRHLEKDQTSLSLELPAAKEAIANAGLTPGDIDLVLSTSFLPDQIGIGNATFICKELGLDAAAWNLETACSSSLMGLQTACSLVQTGQYKHVLVVASCSYSRYIDPNDTFGWFLGDGAAAFVVGQVPAGQGLLASHARHTAETCGAFRYELDVDGAGKPWIAIRAARNAGQLLAENQDHYLHTTTTNALAKASLTLDDVKLVVCNTPTAWFHHYLARVLGIDVERTVSTYTKLANTGPMLLPGNLHHAASRGLIGEGDVVLCFSVGSVSSTSAAVLRWGKVAVGQDPFA